jgi:hypothetical protein
MPSGFPRIWRPTPVRLAFSPFLGNFLALAAGERQGYVVFAASEGHSGPLDDQKSKGGPCFVTKKKAAKKGKKR